MFFVQINCKMNEIYSWEYTNPLLEKHYLLEKR